MSDEINPFASPETVSTPGYSDAAPRRERWMRPYVSGRARATVAILALVLCLIADLLGSVSTYAQIGLLERARAGATISPAEAESNDTRQQMAALFAAAAHLLSPIPFIVWLYRAHANLHALGARNLKHSPGWAIGGWFVPILNLFKPCQIMSEVWKGSDPRNFEYRAFDTEQARGSVLVGVWWASYLIMVIVDRIAAQGSDGAGHVETLIASSWTLLVSFLISVPAAVVAIWLVQSIARNQEERYQLVRRAEQEAPSVFRERHSETPEWLESGELP